MRFSVRILALILISSFAFCLSYENDFIKVFVDDSTGRFSLGTIDNKPLLDGFPDDFSSSHFIINRNSLLLSNQPGLGASLPLLEPARMWDNYITNQYLFDDLKIWQKLRFMDEDSLRRFLSVELLLYNQSTDSMFVGSLYYLDININNNDNPIVRSPWDMVTRDRVYRDTIPGYLTAYENIAEHDSTKMMGMCIPYGRDAIYPDRIFLGNASILGNVTWNFSGSSDITDMSLILRWEPVLLYPTSMQVIEFYWGLPYPDFTFIEEPIKQKIIPNTLDISCYPNPFNSSAKIDVYNPLPIPQNTKIQIFNIYGKLMETILDGELEPEKSTFTWNPVDVESGIYIVKIQSDKVKYSFKLNYLK